ncbi:SET domain protein, partial [Oesophagostomum dentatum]
LYFCYPCVLAEPEPEAPSEVERESSEVAPSQEESAPHNVAEPPPGADPVEVVADVTTSPIKRIVIADSDDDVTDEEDSSIRDVNTDNRLREHDYAVTCASHHLEKISMSKDSFPEMPGLLELGYSPDQQGISSESHTPSRVASSVSSQLSYEQREPNIINRSPATPRDTAVYRTADGQAGYLARPARTNVQAAAGYRATPERSLGHPQQQHFLVAGYGGTPVARRVMTTSAVTSPSIIQQKRTTPRIVSSSAGHMRPAGCVRSHILPRLSSTPHVLMQQHGQRQMAAPVTSAPPMQRQVDPPPHRSGTDPPPHRVLLLQSSGAPRVAYSPADPSQAALANAPAPLIVPGRGTRPIVRGRAGGAAGRAKKESTSGVSGEETSPTHSPQPASRLPLSAPAPGNRATPVSPRKQVHFSDGVAVGSRPAEVSSSFTVAQTTQATSLPPHSGDDLTSQPAAVRSPPKLATARLRSPSTSSVPHVTASPATESAASTQRPAQTATTSTPPLPENFIEDAESGQIPHNSESSASKGSTLPPEVMAAATSLSAQADVTHPQWTNNDISEDDIKAKIEAISREIAQELEQKRMETEAQAKERRRAASELSPSMRRRSTNETIFNTAEEMESGTSVAVPRGRGRPKGSGRTRSSLSSSSSTSVVGSNIPVSHRDVSDGSIVTPRASDFQATRTSGRTANRTPQTAVCVYDGSMAPKLPPPLPPISGAQTIRSGYQGSNLSSPSATTTPRVPDTNGLPADDDLANVSTDPSSDEEPTEEAEWGDYVTRCLCEMQHNDEWMVECEKCNVWQHMKCMGLDPKKFNENETYLCEFCKPRPLKFTKKQAQELQLKQLKAVAREKERKMAEKLKRREERKRAKLNRRLKERNHTKAPVKRGPAAYRKFQLIRRNEYTKRAKQMLALFDTTAGAQSILENSRDLKRGKRMFVAPDVEGLVATEFIKQDDVIMEYVGHVCLPDECPGRLQRGALQPYCVLYNGLGQNLLCIDARRQGSDARFARRCCRSNSTLKHILLNGNIYVMLVASEKIEKGTEVTIPFDCDFRDTLVPVDCACGEDPNCYMKQFNNSLRAKATFEDRASLDVPQESQPSNGVSPTRKTPTTTPKVKAENRGRPKGSGKKEKVVEEVPKKKGAPGRKPKKVGIRLRRHSESKSAKSPESGKEQSGDGETSDQKEEATDTEKQEQQTSESVADPSPSTEPAKEEVVKEETKDATEPAKKSDVSSKKSEQGATNKEEHPTSGKRRSSTGSGRHSRREAIELKEATMDYTLPEDRNKPSREERKLQAALAAFERKEEKEKKKAEAHKEKEVADAKEKRGPGRPSRGSMGSSTKRGRKGSERSVDNSTKEKEKKPEPAVEPVAPRESPRGKKKREESKENEVVEASTMVQPPRKRWAAAVKENEAAQRASSPEVTSSSSSTPMATVDVAAADSVSPSPSSVGGKKLWLRRHAAESISEENSQPVESASTPEQPLSCAADSTSDIAAVPSRVQMSPPLKKRRHMLEACQSDEHVAAAALAQMGSKSEGFRFHWNMALRSLMSSWAGSENVEFQLAESVHKPLPPPTPRSSETKTSADTADLGAGTSSISPPPPAEKPVEVKKGKRLSLEDYKRRRSTMAAEGTNTSSGASSAHTTTSADNRNRTEVTPRITRSFIPSMDVPLEQTPVLRPLDSDLPIPALGAPPDLEVVKKMILEESCLPPPPAPPALPVPVEPPNAAAASSSDMSVGSSSESGEERMSLADRLAKEFGVGTAGAPRSPPKSVFSSGNGHRGTSARDVPPPPPPGPRPTRNTRW